MSDLESLVLQFLERREGTPSLSPEEFSREHPSMEEEVLQATRAAIDVENLLPSEGDRRPRMIAGYAVLEEIGRGGMGVVYRVDRGGHPYALKLLPSASLMSPRTLERFRREAETLSRLSDPGIVRVHETGVHGELPYLVMDLIEGSPLHLLEPSLTISAATSLVERIGRTVHEVHEQGIIHRDLKPQNVLIRPDGQPIVVDFGLSAATGLATLTGTGDILGTPRYMAPEQMLGGETDRRTDVHALGLILYELTTGCPAYRGSNREAILEGVRRGRIPSPRDVRPEFPRPLDRVLRTALARSPERRYQTALELADDLDRFLNGKPVAARPPGALVRAADWCRSVFSTLGESTSGHSLIDPDSLRESEATLDRAVTAWLDGDSEKAFEEIETVRLPQPKNSTVVFLLDQKRSGDQEWEAPDEQDPKDLHPPLAAALLGKSAARAGDLRLAERELSAAARLLPACFRVHQELGSVFTRLFRFQEAEQALIHAASLAPESHTVWRDLAFIHEKRGSIEPGVAAANRALGICRDDIDTQRILASLKDQEGEREDARAILSQLLDRNPEDYASMYLLGLSLDRDHRIAEAVEFYRQVLGVHASHAHSLINLAYLHSGALKGKCPSCDRAYAESPECFDLAKAEHYVLRALEEDRGADAALTRTAVDVALRIEDRTRIVELLEKLTEPVPKTSEILQLQQTLRALKIADPSGDSE